MRCGRHFTHAQAHGSEFEHCLLAASLRARASSYDVNTYRAHFRENAAMIFEFLFMKLPASGRYRGSGSPIETGLASPHATGIAFHDFEAGEMLRFHI